ncbi:very short patch repair endonuclease [Ornithinimicrobium sufpigmenti]|uniref:very short patch repair endonuclease n=1 Tax=Ornithinimicrobium sufpigmenti TaxID=2508882 RepID=UPI001035602C|nr:MULTISPECIES: very short patch repair endonuclease [unclassified Ornithinimicrobium]
MAKSRESWATSPAVRRSMRSNKQRDTAPELALRRAVHGLGLRYRVDYRLPLPGATRRADLAFTRVKVAVFLDGCFWHGCPEHFTVARANAEYWAGKAMRNVERDRDTDLRLAGVGWISMRVWEHTDPAEAAERVAVVVRERRRDGS